MSEPRRDGAGGGPRPPRWLVALLVAGCLLTAAALFWRDARDGEQTSPEASAGRSREQADSVLELPGERADQTTTDADASRRGDQGRKRLDADGGAATRNDDAAEPGSDASASEPLPAVFAALRGRRIALAPASTTVAGDADRSVTVAGLRVACAALADADRVAREAAAIARVASVLQQAGATVIRVGDSTGRGGCVDARVATLEGADLALVIGSSSSAATRVLAGAAGPGDDATANSADFAAELAAALELRGVTRPDDADVRRLRQAAAIDLPDGAAVVLLELPPDDPATTVERARAIVRGMALASARAPRA